MTEDNFMIKQWNKWLLFNEAYWKSYIMGCCAYMRGLSEEEMKFDANLVAFEDTYLNRPQQSLNNRIRKLES